MDLGQIDGMTGLMAVVAAFLVGVSKAGVKGISVFFVTLMVLAFGGRDSTGIIMPLLVLGDIFAVIYYKRHVVWSLLFKLLPAMAIGVIIGAMVGKQMDELLFKRVMSAIILVSVIIMYWWDRRSSWVPRSTPFGIFMGFMAGVTTMIGNLAGAFSNIFFLSMRIDKHQFIGTAAYLYFIINLFKLPFHIWSWETINKNSLLIDLYLFPFLGLGLLTGIHLLKRISTTAFRKMILILTAIGAVAILVR